VINAARKLKIIANFSLGHDNIDVSLCTKVPLSSTLSSYVEQKGIWVTNTPQCINATADMTLALILNVCRRIRLAEMNSRAGKWNFGLQFGVDPQGKVQIFVADFTDIFVS